MIKRYTLHDLRYIFIGRVGERNALTVDIDVSGWLSMFPDGDLELRLSLPDGSMFVPDIERTSDGHLLWTVGDTETEEAGNIAAQLVLLSDGVIAMTFVFECDVLPSGAPVRPVTHVTPPITDIRLTDSDSEADYYTITCADGSTFSFMVRNGKDGQNGADGKDGASGKDGAKGADGVSPAVSFTPIEGGWTLTITDAEGEHSADLKPILLDPAAAVVQEKGESTTAVMSQKAVTDFVESNKGWTDKSINLLDAAVSAFEVAKNDIPFRTETGAAAANTYISRMRELVKSLRGESPEPEDITISVSDGKISTNARSISVANGKIILS